MAIRTPLSRTAFEVGPLFGDHVSIFVNEARSVAAVVSIVTTLCVFLVVNYTLVGKALRAAADNPHAAIYMGVDVNRSYRLAFAIGSAVTGIAGGLIASYQSFQPYVGLDYIIVMFAGVVLGGMGSIIGAFWGGLAIGLVQQLSTIVFPIQLQNTTIFVVFLLVILFRPNGFFGRSAERT
jgi:branched-chain amino acid transport system permease protein